MINYDPEKVLDALISEQESMLAVRFPPAEYPGLQWFAERWDYRRKGVATTRNSYVCFRAHDVDGRMRFHPRFEYALKAYLTAKGKGQSVAGSTVSGARIIWSVLLREGLDPKHFRWSDINQAVFDQMERHALDCFGVKESSARLYLSEAENFVMWLQIEHVLPAGLAIQRTLRQPTAGSLSPKEREARAQRVVSRQVMESLALFHQKAEEAAERLLICAVGLLVICGFRISELLTLPVDALTYDIIGGEKKWYIRYWQRKPGKGKKFEENKRWLSPMAAELAQVLWNEIRDLTAPPRQAARALEQNPSRVRLWWLPDDQIYLSAEDLDRAFGWSSRGSRRGGLRNLGVKSILASSVGIRAPRATKVWRREDIEGALLRKRGPLYTYITATNKRQLLSETLLIVPEQFMDQRKRSSDVLVRMLKGANIEAFLNGIYSSSPLPDGLKTTSHGFRHWLNTVANKAGMSAFLISVWMQRTNIEHTLFYLHDPMDIADLVVEKLRDRKLVGRASRRVYDLNSDQQDEELSSFQVAHIAATVICTLDLTHVNCPQRKLCELCEHGFHDAEDKRMRRGLLARRAALESNLSRLRTLVEKGVPVHARQTEQAEEAIGEIDRILAEATQMLPVPNRPTTLLGAAI